MKLNPFALLLTLLAVSPVHAAETTGPLPLGKFVNAIGEGADPWVVRDPNEPRYLWCYSDGNRGIALRTGDKLSTLAPGKTVWQAPDTGPYSHGIWAPELHFIDNRWHIYFAADAGSNASHLAYVLRAKTADPFGEYDLHGPLATGDGSDGMSPNVWGIDMTPMEFNGSLYAIWSGWDAPGSDKQYLYIAPMNSGVEITAGPRVRICSNNTYPWEYTNGDGTGRGLNEGAEVLQYGGRTFVTYSCGTSLKPTYKLGMLELTGSDPLDPASWVKFPEPVFQGTENVFGAGHSCFVTSPDGTEWWHVYHTKIATSSDWKRRIHIQPFQFNAAGLPQFGIPIPTRTELDVPSGETTSPAKLPVHFSLRNIPPDNTFTYYGHHQLIELKPEGVLLGGPPITPGTNVYRSGEKLILDRTLPADLNIEVTLDFQGDADSRDGGLLFRATGPSIGNDAHRGYFAAILPRTDRVILGKADGSNWTLMETADLVIDTTLTHRLRVETRGNDIKVIVDGETVIEANDDAYPSGGVGLRVFNSSVIFSDLSIAPIPFPQFDPAALATDLFVDTFDRPDDSDPDTSSGGMSGALVPPLGTDTAYWESSQASDTTIHGLALRMAGGGNGMSETAIRYNFTDPAILAAGGFSVQFRIDEIISSTSDISNRFAGIAVGLSAAEAAFSADIDSAGPPFSFRGSVANPVGTADFFVELDFNSDLKTWSNGILLDTTPVGKCIGTLLVCYQTTSFSAGSAVTVSVFLDGTLIDLDTTNSATTRTFTWDASDSNHIGLSARASSSVTLDNLSIRTLPLGDSLASNFALAAGLSGVDTALDQDPDSDGDNNFHEWLKNGDPTAPDAGTKLLALSASPEGEFRFSYAHVNDADTIGLTYTFRYSTDLGSDASTWQTFTPDAISQEPLGGSHTLRLAKVPDSLITSNPKLFILLEVR